MLVEFECTYCGKKWIGNPYSKNEIEGTRCSTCGDTSLKVRDATQKKVDYYQGCPPFPSKYDPYGSND